MSRDIVSQLNRRFDDAREVGDQRHSENITRMDSIVVQVRITNGRVTRLESLYDGLKDEFDAVRKRWHEFRDSVQKAMARFVEPVTTGESRPLTQREFGLLLGLMVGTATIAVVVTLFIVNHAKP